MIIARLLKDVFRLGKKSRLPSGAQEVSRTFLRSNDAPSLLILTHSYRGNGAAEMLMFLIGWIKHGLGWQVNALANELPEPDKVALRKLGIGLVDIVNPEQYDFALANTLVSGLHYIEKFSEHLPCLLWVHEGETVLWGTKDPIAQWKRAFSLPVQIVFQTSWQARHIFGSFTVGLPESKYTIIQNCLPTIPSNSSALKSKSKRTIKRIVFIGGVYNRKRPQDLIEAVIRLDRKDIECVLIGTTELVSTLPISTQSILTNNSQFRLLGELSREETLFHLATADVLSLPSSDESQPIILFEASHFGIPIIISDLPVYQGIWTDGVNCLMHQVGDIDRLTKHLQTCLKGMAPEPMLPNDKDFSQAAFLDNFGNVLNEQLRPPLQNTK